MAKETAFACHKLSWMGLSGLIPQKSDYFSSLFFKYRLQLHEPGLQLLEGLSAIWISRGPMRVTQLGQ
jgi:hypothetical protein